MNWHDPGRNEAIRQWFAQGLTSGQIMRKFKAPPVVNRNMIAGLKNRLMIESIKREKPGPKLRPRVEPRAMSRPKVLPEPTPPPGVHAPDASTEVDLFGLKSGQCRYLVRNSVYCGAASKGPYCTYHKRMVYR